MQKKEDFNLSIPKVYIKDGVVINGAHMYPEIVKIIDVARATAPLLSDNAVWITSANDSEHMEGSLHYANRAYDIRIWNVVGPNRQMAEQWTAKMQLALGDHYDIILEKDHIHAEYQPV